MAKVTVELKERLALVKKLINQAEQAYFDPDNMGVDDEMAWDDLSTLLDEQRYIEDALDDKGI